MTNINIGVKRKNRMGDRKITAVLCFLSFLFIIIAVYLLLNRDSHKVGYSLAELPKRAVEITGKPFDRRFLRDKVVVVQYGGEVSNRQLEAWLDYEDQIAYVFILEKKPDNPLPFHQNYIVLDRKSVESYDRFYGRYFVLDHSGTPVHWGYCKGSNVDGIGLALASIFRNFNPAELFPNDTDINELLKNAPESKHVILALFRSFCSTCRTGSLLERLVRIHSLKNKEVSIIVVLDGNIYSEEDTNSLAAQADLPFPMIISEPILTSRLSSLSFYFGGSLLDGMLFLFDNGHIVDTANVSCRCDDRFFQNIEQLAIRGDTPE